MLTKSEGELLFKKYRQKFEDLYAVFRLQKAKVKLYKSQKTLCSGRVLFFVVFFLKIIANF